MCLVQRDGTLYARRGFLTQMSTMGKPIYSAQAPGKINLGLHVLRRRDDGYHDLETVFYPLQWSDTLSVREAPLLTLSCTDPVLDCGESNLVMRAARALAAAAGKHRGAAMELVKRLPMGAGLGGGSSDAAVALRLLSRLWSQPVTDATLLRLALSLGSDVPFFLNPVPSYATGRGEMLTPLEGYAIPYTLVVVVPHVHISTKWAFGRITPVPTRSVNLRAVVQSNDLDYWCQVLVNDFEAPVFDAYPALRARKEELLNQGAAYASLTGTGAAVFGVFEDWGKAVQGAAAAREAGCTVHLEHSS